MDFVKKLLFSLVGSSETKGVPMAVADDHPNDDVDLYVEKLVEAGLLESVSNRHVGAWEQLRLTASGYKFLSVSLEGALWRQVKSRAFSVKDMSMLPVIVAFALSLGGF